MYYYILQITVYHKGKLMKGTGAKTKAETMNCCVSMKD